MHPSSFETAYSKIWRYASTGIRSAKFECLVITRRRGIIPRHWVTAILRGDPDAKPTPFCAVSYLPHLKRDRILAIHGDVANYINELGDQGATLYQAFDTVTLHLAIQRFIDKEIEMYEDIPAESFD